MSEEKKRGLENDILYQIGMQLYDEFNDKIATMRDYIGDIYSLRDIEEVEQAEKEREIELLRKAVITQQKEIEELKVINQMQKYRIETIDEREFVSKDKIREKMEELLKEGKLMTEEQRQKETEYMQGKLRAYEELLEEN